MINIGGMKDETMWFDQHKSQKLAVLLAIVGAVTPLAGLHKFYLRQPWWGVIYLIVSVILPAETVDEFWVFPYFGMAQVASLVEGLWYFWQSEAMFKERFGRTCESSRLNPHLVGETTEAIRKLDQLRAEGLLSEYEFEQQRRQLVEGIRK